MIYKMMGEALGTKPKFFLIISSPNGKEGEALGTKTSVFSHNLSPQCFAPTGEKSKI
jgi:hypothetical protein